MMGNKNELFDNYMHQDTHEFLKCLLNTTANILQEKRKQKNKMAVYLMVTLTVKMTAHQTQRGIMRLFREH